MTVVVDSSLAIKWVFREELTGDALGLLRQWRAAGERLIAPPLFRAEVANVAWQKVRQGEATLLEAVDAVELLLEAVTVEEPPGLYRRGLDLASAFAQGSVYDALYLALADAHFCPFFTADRRFALALKGSPFSVRFLGEAR